VFFFFFFYENIKFIDVHCLNIRVADLYKSFTRNAKKV